MKITRVYIACYKGGVHLTRCCVASVRHWYPELPISLVKDEIDGPFDTGDMQEYWDVDVLRTQRRRFGSGTSKFEVLTLPERQRVLVLDDDIVFLGRVIDRLERFDEDFVVASHGGPPEQFEHHYFDRHLLLALDADFRYQSGAFNTGQFVATTGILREDDLVDFLTPEEPRTLVHPDVFHASEQGLLNYLLLKRCQEGRISLRHDEFMWWSEWLPPRRVNIDDLRYRRGSAVLLHWAGPKPGTLEAMRHAAILRFFNDLFYSRIPEGQRQREMDEFASAVLRRRRKRRDAALRILRDHTKCRTRG